MESMISSFLKAEYGLTVTCLQRMTTGVGGDTFRVQTTSGDYVFKIVKSNSINHPGAEAELCAFLRLRGIPASEFLPDRRGMLASQWPDGRFCHLQRLIHGSPFGMNTAPAWFLQESAGLLGNIHAALKEYSRLPEGIGAGFFAHMTPENALHSYRSSLRLATERGEHDVCDALELRISLAEKRTSWRIDPAPLTCLNTHGDFTVNQVLCEKGRITGVIDWTSACVHPAVWELTRSYFYAAPECRNGSFDESGLRAYVSAYEAICPLSAADHAMLLDVYLYQLLVCDYYAQYLHAAAHEAQEFLQQANFATRVLKKLLT